MQASHCSGPTRYSGVKLSARFFCMIQEFAVEERVESIALVLAVTQ